MHRYIYCENCLYRKNTENIYQYARSLLGHSSLTYFQEVYVYRNHFVVSDFASGRSFQRMLDELGIPIASQVLKWNLFMEQGVGAEGEHNDQEFLQRGV